MRTIGIGILLSLMLCSIDGCSSSYTVANYPARTELSFKELNTRIAWSSAHIRYRDGKEVQGVHIQIACDSTTFQEIGQPTQTSIPTSLVESIILKDSKGGQAGGIATGALVGAGLGVAIGISEQPHFGAFGIIVGSVGGAFIGGLAGWAISSGLGQTQEFFIVSDPCDSSRSLHGVEPIRHK